MFWVCPGYCSWFFVGVLCSGFLSGFGLLVFGLVCGFGWCLGWFCVFCALCSVGLGVQCLGVRLVVGVLFVCLGCLYGGVLFCLLGCRPVLFV